MWSPSASEANFNCAGRIALIDLVKPEDSSSEAADWGTAAHEIAEWSLRTGNDAIDFAEPTLNVNGRSIVVDEELRDTAQSFVDYVRERIAEYRLLAGEPVVLIERRVAFEPGKLPLACNGLGDCILVFPAWNEIEVVDLKGGYWYVDHVRNKQLGTYGIAAIDEGLAEEVSTLRTTIVQPRAIGHGSVRTYLWDAAELDDHRRSLRAANRRSFDVRRAVREAGSDTERSRILGAELSAGDHCKFCPVAGRCQARAEKELARARTFFKPVGIPAPPAPATLSNDQLADVLDAAPMIKDWLDTVETYAKHLVQGGHQLVSKRGRYGLQDAYGNRAFTENNAHEELMLCYGIPEKELYVTKPKTPAQVETVLKKHKVKNWQQLMKQLADKPKKGVSLVREDLRTKPESAPKVHQHFKPIEDQNG